MKKQILGLLLSVLVAHLALSQNVPTRGQKARPFRAKTLRGLPVNFPSDYRGKVVLLDFWATYCPPCMQEMPNVVKAYNKYHARGFDILGISLDGPKTKKDISRVRAKKGMKWNQICDYRVWETRFVKLYGVDVIPHEFLVNGNTGRVIAEGDTLYGEGLDAAVKGALSTLHK